MKGKKNIDMTNGGKTTKKETEASQPVKKKAPLEETAKRYFELRNNPEWEGKSLEDFAKELGYKNGNSLNATLFSYLRQNGYTNDEIYPVKSKASAEKVVPAEEPGEKSKCKGVEPLKIVEETPQTEASILPEDVEKRFEKLKKLLNAAKSMATI